MTVARIAVGVDGSAGSRAAVAWVAELAAQTAATVVAIHVFEPLELLGRVDPPYDMAALGEAARRRLDDEWIEPLTAAGIATETVWCEGSPAPALADAAVSAGADLIVVGDRGHSPLRKLVIGSTALKLPHTTSLPVTIVRTPDDA